MPLAKEYNIKWKQKDYLTLGRAVSKFNKRINELQQIEYRSYLPNTLNYSEVKQNITTRKELNKVLASLKRFSLEGAEELYTTKAGEQITKWEKSELERQIKTARGRLTLQLSELNIPNIEGFSRVQMGSEEARKIESNLKSLNNLELKRGYEFDELRRRINVLGASDYNMKKASVYQENIMQELDNLRKEVPEFNKIYEYFNNIKNPITFYNTVKKSDAMADFFTWYKKPENYASFKTDSEVADYIIEQYKEMGEYEDTMFDYDIKLEKRGRRRYALVSYGNIISSSNDLSKIYNMFREYDTKAYLNIIDLQTDQVIE